MITDEELKVEGLKVLTETLGDVLLRSSSR